MNQPPALNPTLRSPKRTTILCCSIGMSLLISSCGESKVSQCNRLIALINKASEAWTENQSGTIAEDNIITLNTSSKLRQYARELELMFFTDSQIKIFQARLVKLYGAISDSGEAVVAAPPNNFEAVRQTNRVWIALWEQEGPLVNEVNEYCGAK